MSETMNKSPAISIIVPTRNRPHLLQAALASIAAQRCDDYEVIVIDDGSDETQRSACAALPELADARFRLHLLGLSGQHGSGPSVIRNAGLDLARGEIVVFLDDDDCWTDPEHLARLLAAFAAHPDVDAYIARQQAVRTDGSITPEAWLPGLATRLQTQTVLALPAELAALTEAGGFAHLNIFAVRRSLALAIGGFWERTSYEEDRDFFWRSIDRAAAVVFDPHVVARHNIPDRAKQDNVTTRYSQTERWLISVLVSQHISVSVRRPAIARLNRGYAGDILRHLSRHHAAEQRLPTAAYFARQALAARYSSKWLAYTLYLSLLACMRKTEHIK